MTQALQRAQTPERDIENAGSPSMEILEMGRV